jgi:hypothetical protein
VNPDAAFDEATATGRSGVVIRDCNGVVRSYAGCPYC